MRWGLFLKEIPLRQNGVLLTSLGLYILIWGALAWEPYNRFDWFLENLLIFAAAIVLGFSYKKFAFSNLSYLLLFLFLMLHTIGAHYSYNTNPLDAWLKTTFHFPRDEFDRIVHFSFGLLLAYPMREWAMRVLHWSRRASCFLIPLFILGCGAFYELIEMWVASIVAPEIGVMFLGTQGDPWDTQHDMAVALYGAIVAMGTTALIAVLARARK